MRRFFSAILVSIVALVATVFPSYGWHIIGGELYYDHLGGNTYTITLKVYRDCYTVNGAPYDDPVWIGVYNGALLEQTVQIYFPGSVHLPVTLDDPCLSPPPDVCVEEAIYTTTVTFDNVPASGLQVVYQRCCRNSTILNIYTPADVGATYVGTIFPPSVTNGNNSSPRFKNFPPIAICANQPLEFDHSATDPDGDSLVYELCVPYQGATSTDPMPMPAGPPPYNYVSFISPYNVNNMLGGTPPMYIDPQTGILYAQPNTIGQFVVGVCVSEYRNGQLISTHKRDFQFNVAPCEPTVEAKFKVMTESSPLPADTVIVCSELTILFENLSIGEINRTWDFGDPTTGSDISTEDNPTYTYPDTGLYVVELIVNPGTYCADTAYKALQLRYGLVANIKTGDLIGCTNSSIQFEDSSQALDGALSEWLWSFGDGATGTGPNPTHAYALPGTYEVTLNAETDLGCSDEQTAQVTVYPTPILISGPDTTVCDIDSVRLFTSPGLSYSWAPNYELSDSSIRKPMAAPDSTTTYIVSVTNEFNCAAIDSVTIQVVDTVIATAWPDTTVCAGQFVQLHNSGARYYQWFPENEILSLPLPEGLYVKPETTTTYYAHSFIGSCFDVDSVVVNVMPLPIVQTVESQVINQGDTVQLDAVGAINYVWTPPYRLSNDTISNPLAYPLQSTSYVVTGFGENGCFDVDTVVLLVTHFHNLFVPNVFSPNGDGFNEFFWFHHRGIKEILAVDIYNRWGEKVYSLDAARGEPWDGTHNGVPQGIGVFVYVIRAETYDGAILHESGNVTLLR